jgi:peroxiredoxin
VSRNFLIMTIVALLAASGGYFVARLLGTSEGIAPAVVELQTDNDLLGMRRPDFTLDSVNGEKVSASDFDGQVWLVNFWATWCKPCVEEMPMLSQVQSDFAGQGVTVVGIALDDAERARQFARDLSIQYPILVGQADVVLTGRYYGNSSGLLPFSVLVDAEGVVRWSHLGALDHDELLRQITSLK